MKRKPNLAVLVGAGSGDAQLLTLAGAAWLARADVVVYDRLASPALLNLAPPQAQRIYVGKSPAGHAMEQEQINQLLVDLCLEGKLTVRLKGGDPYVFGRGGEEADALVRAGVPFRVVPGVTAAMAAGAYAGIPLTDRRWASSLALVTGHEDPTKPDTSINWRALAGIDTLVFYMGIANLPQIAEQLISAGKSPDTPVALVERATTPRQRTVTGTLATIAQVAMDQNVRAPALTIVGKVVQLRPALAWFEHLPLSGQTVLVTRTREQASKLSAALAEQGAEVIEAPTIATLPPSDFAPLDAALKRLAEFDWLAVTSPNGVQALFERLAALGLDARAFGRCKVAAVGPATAEALKQRAILPDLVPAEFTTAGLAEALGSSAAGKRVLLARADIATAQLTDTLAQAGAKLTEVVAYRTVCPDSLPPEAAAALEEGRVDWITFTSSSTAENFLKLVQAGRAETWRPGIRTKLAAIGPVTADTLRRHGLEPTVMAQTYTIDGLVEAMKM